MTTIKTLSPPAQLPLSGAHMTNFSSWAFVATIEVALPLAEKKSRRCQRDRHSSFYNLPCCWLISLDITCDNTDEPHNILNTLLSTYSARENSSCDFHKLYILINCLLSDLFVLIRGTCLWSSKWEEKIVLSLLLFFSYQNQ